MNTINSNSFIFNNLPNDIKNKIMYLAHPILSDQLKRSIKVESANKSLEYLNKIYIDYCIKNSNENINFKDIINKVFDKNQKKIIINNLKQCGCCERHSKGIFSKPHCNNVNVKHTITKKETLLKSNKCNCWCRHNIRWFINSNKTICY